MRWIGLALAAWVSAAGPVQAMSAEAARLLGEAEAACTAFEEGTFDAGEAVSEIGLTSQFGAVTAEVIEESAFSCSSAASLYCGTGGCMLNLVIDGQVRAWQATGWRLVDWGPDTVLLLGRDGGWCGGAGAEVCYEALVWSQDRFLSVGPAPKTR